MQRNEKQGIDMDRSVVLRRENTVPCAAGGSAATASAGYGKPLFHGEQRLPAITTIWVRLFRKWARRIVLSSTLSDSCRHAAVGNDRLFALYNSMASLISNSRYL